jgi:hypothetical protein
MEPKRLIVAAALLAVLAGALWWSNNEQGKPQSSPDDPPKILEIPQDQIAKIEIRRMGAEPVLLEKAAAWSIKSPHALPADADAMRAMESALAVITSERLVDEKMGDRTPYGLQSPLLSIVVGRKDGKSHTLHLGDDTPSGSGTYAYMDGEAKLYLLPVSTKTALEKTWRDLRDKRLLPFDSAKLTRVELSAKGGPVEFGRNNANAWTILKPRPVRADNSAVEDFVRKLQEARMEITNDTEEEASYPARFAAAAPVGVAKVTTESGSMQVEIRKGKENDYYARSSAVEGVFKTTGDLGESLAKGFDDFRSRKLFEFGFNEPERVEVKQDGSAYLFTKSGAEWKRDGKSIEPGSVQQIIDRLRELTATKFADSAAGAIAAEYTVTMPGGKGVESVTVTRQGDAYFARKAGDNEVYVLDATAVGEVKRLAAEAKEIPAASGEKTKK